LEKYRNIGSSCAVCGCAPGKSEDEQYEINHSVNARSLNPLNGNLDAQLSEQDISMAESANKSNKKRVHIIMPVTETQ
jgi:hypothetical protein